MEKVELDPETGLFSTDYDSVSETVYNESAAIQKPVDGPTARMIVCLDCDELGLDVDRKRKYNLLCSVESTPPMAYACVCNM